MTTENKLLTGYQWTANGGAHYSIVDGVGRYWEYRQEQDPPYAPCCDPEHATCIYIDVDPHNKARRVRLARQLTASQYETKSSLR